MRVPLGGQRGWHATARADQPRQRQGPGGVGAFYLDVLGAEPVATPDFGLPVELPGEVAPTHLRDPPGNLVVRLRDMRPQTEDDLAGRLTP